MRRLIPRLSDLSEATCDARTYPPRDEHPAEQDAEDRAWSDEQDKDRRVWNEVYP